MKKNLLLFQLMIGLSVLIIFDLSCTKEDENTPPAAAFTISPETGTPDTIFTFDASGCSDEQDQASGLQVRWDWQNDGNFDTDFSTNKILDHQFSQLGVFQITLEVRDSKNSGNSITKTLNVTGSYALVTTDTITNISENSAICGGNVTQVYGIPVTARGVCWNTLPNPTTEGNHTTDGSGDGKFESYLTGLLIDTTYFVRAYATNSIGTAYGNERSFTTLSAVITCDDFIVVNHVAGNVAPVDKTVTYYIVTDIPGDTAKCWITHNLGADHQATSKEDYSEASAGWYWQFNRMQGYKHDGTARTPNTTWISSITENSDWQAANDPCAHEIGIDWRIPTYTEWLNVYEAGEWTNWNGPWNSDLKIHAGGYLNFLTGELIDRGLTGDCWSNTQLNAENGWRIGIYWEGDSGISTCSKAYGVSLRCLKNR